MPILNSTVHPEPDQPSKGNTTEAQPRGQKYRDSNSHPLGPQSSRGDSSSGIARRRSSGSDHSWPGQCRDSTPPYQDLSLEDGDVPGTSQRTDNNPRQGQKVATVHDAFFRLIKSRSERDRGDVSFAPSSQEQNRGFKHSCKNFWLSRPRYVLLIFIVLIICLLVLVVTLGVTLRAEDNDDDGKGNSADNGNDSDVTMPLPRVYDPDMTTDADFVGTFTLSASWDEDLTNRRSSAFRYMATEKEQLLDAIYRASNLSDVYNYSVVTEFRQGSVVVTFKCKLLPKPELTSEELRSKHDQVRHNAPIWTKAFKEGLTKLTSREDNSVPMKDVNADSVRALVREQTTTTATTAGSTSAPPTPTTEVPGSTTRLGGITTAVTTTTAPPTTPAVFVPDDDSCGDVRSLPEYRMMGGRPAGTGEYPWVASIRKEQLHLCGGSVIDPLHVITAARCVDKYVNEKGKVDPTVLDLVVGEHKRDPIRAVIARVYIHEEFLRHSEDVLNDIALIRLKHPLTFSSRVSPVCLPKVTTQMPRQCVAAGWGTTKHEYLEALQAVTLQTYTSVECHETFGATFLEQMGKNIDLYLNDGVMCAANLTHGEEDTCQGDNGGPLFCLEERETGERRYTQYGVVSWGYGCGIPGRPGFYTYLPYYLQWLHNTAKPTLERAIAEEQTCLQTFCLDLFRQMFTLQQEPFCRLLDSSVQCMLIADQTGNCTRERVYEEVTAFLTHEVETVPMGGVVGGVPGFNDTVTLNKTADCTDIPAEPSINVCNDSQLHVRIAEQYCDLIYTLSDDLLCVRIFPNLSHCVSDLLSARHLGDCSLQDVTSSLARGSSWLQQKSQSCSAYCPGFAPDDCMEMYASEFASLRSRGLTQECRVNYEGIRCVSAKLELAGRPCEETTVRSSIITYLGQVTTRLDQCDASFPALASESTVCENADMLNAISNDYCQTSTADDYSSGCSKVNVITACVTKQLRITSIYCPFDTVFQRLGPLHACNVDASGSPGNDAVVPRNQCVGQSAADTLSALVTRHCDVIVNRLKLIWTSEANCSVVKDLLQCAVLVASHNGYSCTEQDVVTLAPSMTQFPVDGIQAKFTQCIVSPSTIAEHISRDVCGDVEMVQLMARYSCPRSLQTVITSSSDTFCENLDKASDCISTAFEFHGLPCRDFRHLIYRMFIPTVYYLYSYDLCLSSVGVRLVDGSAPSEGRVEVMVEGQWGTVCNYLFGAEDAEVVCRMLGYSGGSSTVAFFGEGSGPILLSSLKCTGGEENVLQCERRDGSQCEHYEDVGVKCSEEASLPEKLPAPTAPVLEVPDTPLPPASRDSMHVICRFFPVWSTSLVACHVTFPQLLADSQCSGLEATVTCIQTELARHGAYCNKQSVYDRLLSLVDENHRSSCEEVTFDMPALCNDKFAVTSISDQCVREKTCMGSIWELAICVHTYLDPQWEECGSRDIETIIRANFQDLSNVPLCQDYDVRRIEDGRIMTYVQGEWWWLCADDWRQTEADVVCRQLGYSFGKPSLVPRTSGSVMVTEGVYASGSFHVTCVGTETALQGCSLNRTHSCSTSHVAAVVCYNNAYRFELVTAQPNDQHGFVKLTRDEGEGHVCLPEVTDLNAHVLCLEAGYAGGSPSNAPPPSTSPGPVWRLEMECGQQTTDVNACLRPPYWSHQVTTDGDCQVVNVFCYSSQARLHNGFSNTSGIVMMYRDGSPAHLPSLHPVCRDGFTNASATIFCVESGFPLGGHALPYNPFYLTHGDYVSAVCTGSESRLQDCVISQTAWSGCSGPAVVRCNSQNAEGAAELSAKLAPDGTQLLVYTDGQWGTVCADHWTDAEANAACRQMGHPHGYVATSIPGGTYPHVLHEVKCDVSDSSLGQCSFQHVRSDACQIFDAAAVKCTSEEKVTYSLKGGTSSNYGLVYVNTSSALPLALLHAELTPTLYDILCRTLGFTSGEEYLGPLSPPGGPTSLPLWQAEFDPSCFSASTTPAAFDLCRNNSGSRSMCESSSTTDCTQRAAKAFCYKSKVRLHTGFHNTTGIVQILQDGVWWDTCPYDITQTAANVICRDVMGSRTATAIRLGLSDLYFPHFSSTVRRGSTVTCTDDDVIAADCITIDVDVECDMEESATVVCYDENRPHDQITEWRVDPNGRVVVKRYGMWGTVCEYSFSAEESKAVCRQSGSYSGRWASPGPPSPRVPMWVEAMECAGANEYYNDDDDYSNDDYFDEPLELCTITAMSPTSDWCYSDAFVDCF